MEQASAYQRTLGILVLFTLAAGDFWRYLLSWWGWGALTAILLGLVVIELIRARVSPRRLPLSLLAFVALTFASIAWSAYPLETTIAAVTTAATVTAGVFVAACFTWDDVRGMMTAALRWIIGLSLAFELFVSVVIRERVLPIWVDWSDLEKVPASFYWSRNLLLDGGRIQGIVGNANLLGMIAVIALAVFGVRLITREGSPLWGWIWFAAAAGTVALTRSSTALASLVGMVLVVVYLMVLRSVPAGRRIAVHLGAAGFAAVIVAAVLAFRGPILNLLGKSSDLTYRFDIWDTVWQLASERPATGWGWISYWAPWVEPYSGLIEIRGVTYLQAHNAWLDVFLQLGIIGLVVFGALVLSTAARSWLLAIGTGDRPWARALPLVLLVALIVQSLAESRLLLEIGLTLLVIISIATTWTTDRASAPRGDRER